MDAVPKDRRIVKNFELWRPKAEKLSAHVQNRQDIKVIKLSFIHDIQICYEELREEKA